MTWKVTLTIFVLFFQIQSTKDRATKNSATITMHSGITVYTVIYIKYHTSETSKI